MHSDGMFPKGTVTLLFADIEGSTRLLGLLGKKYTTLLSNIRVIVRECITYCNGVEVGMEGDGFFAVFPRADDSVESAVAIQQRISSYKWPDSVSVKIRIGLHTGEPWVEKEGYVGMDVHRAARISNLGHGGQILLSETTAALMRDELPKGIKMINLGRFYLKDFQKPENIHQLVIPYLPSEFPPLKSSRDKVEGRDIYIPSSPDIQNQEIDFYKKTVPSPSEIVTSSSDFSKSQVQIFSLGGLFFRRGAEQVAGFSSRKVKALLVYLVVQQNPCSIEHIAKLFYENRGLPDALTNLELALKNLDNTINGCIFITANTVGINAQARFWLDVFEFKHFMEEKRIVEALELYQGDFLAGLKIRGSKGFQDWVNQNRDQLRQLAQDMYDKLFSHCITEKEFNNCMDIAAKMVIFNPLNENNHRRMMFLKFYFGMVEEALQQYERLSNILKNESGKEPSLESYTLYTKILDGDLGLEDISPITDLL